MNCDIMPTITGIVLAGGLSTRMGRDKASLPWGDSDLLHTVLERLAPACAELIVVSNVSRDIKLPGVRVVPDLYPQCGPIAGMHAGMIAAANDYSFIVACDMPYLVTGAVSYMARAAAGYDAAVPYIDGYYHPLHGVYHKRCLEFINVMLKERRYRPIDFYPDINLRHVGAEELAQFDPTLAMLDNINTPAELRKAKSAEVME